MPNAGRSLGPINRRSILLVDGILVEPNDGRCVRIRPRPQAIANERGSTRSRCGGGLWLLSCLPVPRKKVDDFVGGMIGQPGQHVGKPGLRIDVVHLASFDKGIDGGGTMAASI